MQYNYTVPSHINNIIYLNIEIATHSDNGSYHIAGFSVLIFPSELAAWKFSFWTQE